jgi:hypothetical protein
VVRIEQRRDCDVHDIISRSYGENLATEDLLRRWLRISESVWIGMYDDQVACVWGIHPSSMISDKAYMWMLATDLVDQHRFIFVRHSQLIVEQTLKRYPIIIGTVKVGNDRARKWLRWLGAEIGPPVDHQSHFVIRRK